MTIRYAIPAVLLLTIAGCSKEEPKTPVDTNSGIDATPAPKEKPAADVADNKDKQPERGSIALGPKLAKLCDLPTALFSYDSTALGATATKALDALATCFISGPAKGKAVRIVGHADPRGETEYNFGLGQKRAGVVASFLLKRGMPENNIESSSRGELDAIGSDEDGWAQDRKVEIFLADD